MFNYKKFSLPKFFTIFFSYSTNKTESPCANSKYSQCLNCFSYLLPAVSHFAHSFARGKVNFWMAIFFCLFSILDHSDMHVSWPLQESVLRGRWPRFTTGPSAPKRDSPSLQDLSDSVSPSSVSSPLLPSSSS